MHRDLREMLREVTKCIEYKTSTNWLGRIVHALLVDESLGILHDLRMSLQMNADKAGSQILGERFHWSQRTTGITEQFEAYYGRWTHYDVAALPDLEVSRSGRIRKSLKGGDPEDNTFILNSCFEMGPDMNKQHGMAQGCAPFVTKRDDGKQFFNHPFKYSPGALQLHA